MYIVKIEKEEQIIYQQAKEESELDIWAVITAVNKVKRHRKLKIDSVESISEKRGIKKKIIESECIPMVEEEHKPENKKEETYFCSICKNEISKKTAKHSIENYGNLLCVDCQSV